MPTDPLIPVEKTKSWKEFEYICKDVLQIKYNQEFQLFGKQGEIQKGIDIVSKEAFWNGGFVVAQCKDYSDTKKSTKRFLEKISESIEKISNLDFAVSQIVIMTALDYNANIQEFVRSNWPHNTPDILFWDEIGEIINENIVLLRKYYPQKLISQTLVKTNLFSRILYPKANFYGRETELLQIWDILSECNHIFIYGPGGYGKTELVKKYCQTYKNQYSTIIFTTFQKSLLDIITDDSVIKSEKIQRRIVNDISMEDDESYYTRKIEFLSNEAQRAGDILLIVDDFCNMHDEKLQDILSTPLKIIFTTRLVVDKEFYRFRIEPIDNNEIGLFCNFYNRRLTQNDVDSIKKIVELFKNHTYLIKLIATDMYKNRKKPAEMYEKLITSGLSADEDIYGKILRLFNFEKLNKNQLTILYLLTYIPLTGIRTCDFCEVNHFDNYGDINYLCDHSWVECDEKNDIISLHPLMVELVEKNKDNWEIPGTAIDTFINGLSDKVSLAWFEKFETIYPYESIVLYILERFTSYSERTVESVAHLADFCYITVHYKECFKYTQKVYNFCVQNFGVSNEITIKICLMFIDRCYNLAAFDKSIQLAESLLSVFSEAENCVFVEQKIDLYRMLSRNYRAVDKYVKAKDYIDRAKLLELPLKSVAREKLEFEDIRVQVAFCDYEKASAILGQHILLVKKEKIFSEDSIYYSSIYQLRGCILNALRQYSKALDMYQRAEKLELKYHRSGIVCSNIYINIGDTYALLGDDSKAKEYYDKTLTIREKYFNKDHPMITDVIQRIDYFNTSDLDRYDFYFSPSEWK